MATACYSVTDSVLVEAAKRSVPTGTSAAVASAIERVRNTPKPSQFPFYGYISVDARGRVWAEGHNMTNQRPFPWMVFDSTGRSLGRVVPPTIATATDVRMISAFADEVLLRWRDGDGFVHLSFHRLR